MASKAHINNTVNERRLRPIYDWLDNGNNKKALQEADKVLKKQPDNQCARVLKALALLRLGKEDKCQDIMDKVRSEVPCDDSTLQAMSICYKEIHQPDKIREVYEAAAKADPNNEDLLTHLFMSYVRLGDFKKQQQTALALYKLKPKNPYYFWAVMSVVMQAIQAEDALAKNIILPLAERMVLKLVNEGKLEAEQEVQLYIMILELQGKNEQILDVLSGPLAARLSGVPQRKAALLLQLQRYEEATTAFKELINEDNDNWSHYLSYLTAALEHQQPSECLEFLDSIAETCGKKARAPHLARFELLKRVGSSNVALRAIMEPVKLMRLYFEQFGNKGCTVGDLRLYLNLLNFEEQSQLLESMNEDIGIADDAAPTKTDQMLRHIHCEQLRRACGMHHSPILDIEKRQKLVDRLRDLYEKGNELCINDERLPTDFAPFDSYALLAAHLLIQMWYESYEASHLYKAMALLERALSISVANFHLKIVLIRVYLEAGLIGAADHVFSLLDAKQIQLVSLSYLYVPLLAPLGHLSSASNALDQAVKFFVANYKHSADRLTFAYKYGSFAKIQEFVDLRERLDNSLHFATSTVDKMLLELSWCDSAKSLSRALVSMRVLPHEDSIRWELLRDNRDLEVVVGWEPSTDDKDPRKHEETRVCMLQLLAARNLILRIIAATAEEQDCSLLLAKLSHELETLNNERIPKCLEKFMTADRRVRVESILVPIDAVERLRESYDSQQLMVIARLADSFSQFSRPNSQCIEIIRNAHCLKTLPIPTTDEPVSYKDFLLRAATCGETLSFLGIMCASYINQAHPQINNKKNRKKTNKEVESSFTADDIECWTEISDLFMKRTEKLENVLSEFEKRSVNTGLDTEEKAAAIVAERVQESIHRSCWMLRSRLQLTTKLLNNFRS
ncbi:GSCOCG00007626001-RA-CDS [Cotesia congregata]|uniref:N-terminal acetyltransferase B complex subunit MDM20 homolog n=1 Tax=Cotesia congregata TaxID=51543 RepID=A0A8J2MV08_COTCN|nr:GSCOCG00007626001-RA-CDS [Cotesia congregata]CAG5097023.1 NatB auxiliary subunit (Rattus norvegicus) [Cotesia congregata]